MFNAQTEGKEFVKPAKLALNKVYPLRGVFFTNGGRYGESPVIISDDFLLNAPKHCSDVLHQLAEDTEAVEAINGGKVGFSLYEYESGYKTTCRGVRLVDL